MQRQLQEFAWTEAEKDSQMQDRLIQLPQLAMEPVFCFETAVKLYYFSHVAYHYQQVQSCNAVMCCL